MSFTIKCDKCGHTDKFTEHKHRNSKRVPIVISIETEPGNASSWYSMSCTACGHKVNEL